jgi:hypothetical protein
MFYCWLSDLFWMHGAPDWKSWVRGYHGILEFRVSLNMYIRWSQTY